MSISDRTLRKWLRTGRPRRVERHLDDPEVIRRLDAMTELDESDRAALMALTNPADGFNERIVEQVRVRQGTEMSGVVLDLLGLGWHTAAVMLEPKSNPNPQDPD